MPPFSPQAIAARLRTIVIPGTSRRIGAIALALVLWIGAATAAHELGGRPLFVLATLGGAFLVALLLDWRYLLASAVLLVLVEALPRRYLANDVALFFVKDVALAIAYAKFVLERRRTGRPLLPRTRLLPALAALAVLVVLELANPYLPAFAVGVVGLHGWLWYVPIAILVPEAIESPTRAVAWLRAFALVSLPLAVLAALQIRHPSLNRNYYDDIYGPSGYSLPNGGTVRDRSVSTFASTGAYGDYLVFVVVATFALAVAVPRARRSLLLAALFTGFLLAIGGSASRGVVAALFVAVVVFALLTLRLDRRLALVGGLTCALVAASFALYPYLPGLHRAVVSGLSPTSIGDRIREYVGEPMAPQPPPIVTRQAPPATRWLAVDRRPAGTPEPDPERVSNVTTKLIGHGTGLGSPGRQYLDPFLSDRELREVTILAGPEGGWLNVTWEFGVVGALVLLGVFGTIATIARGVYRSAIDDDTRILGALGFLLVGTTAALMFLSTKIGQVNYTILFWAAVGLMLVGARPVRDERL